MSVDARPARALLAWLLRQLRWRYAVHLSLTLAVAAAWLLPPQLFRYFVSALHEGAVGSALAWRILLLGLAIALLLATLTFVGAISREKIQLRCETALRMGATRQMLSAPLETFDGLPRGEFLSRLGGDLTKVEMFIAATLPSQLRQLATLILASTVFLWQCGPMALVPLALVSTVGVLGYFAHRRLLPLLEELRVMHGGIFQEMLQSFESVRTLRTHGASQRHLEAFRWRLVRMSARSLRVVAYAGAFDSASTFGHQAILAGCLAFAAWRVASGQMAFDTALTFPFYLGFVYSAAEGLAASVGEWNRFLVDSRRLWQLLPSLTESSEPVGEPTVRAIPRRLHARNLRFGYRGQALQEPVHFTLQTGQTWVLVGPSGAGKSTLLEVFAGLRSPIDGEIQCLDAEGTPLPIQSNTDLASLCAVVEQRACLWSGTVRANLTLGASDLLADSDLWDSLRSVGLDSVVRAAGGLDAEVDDRGQNFSEGQRYRLALARALLLPRPFLLLDEPFAALDAESIATVIRAINRDKRHRGYLIVTHQIPNALTIDGRVEIGTAIVPACDISKSLSTSTETFCASKDFRARA